MALEKLAVQGIPERERCSRLMNFFQRSFAHSLTSDRGARTFLLATRELMAQLDWINGTELALIRSNNANCHPFRAPQRSKRVVSAGVDMQNRCKRRRKYSRPSIFMSSSSFSKLRALETHEILIRWLFFTRGLISLFRFIFLSLQNTYRQRGHWKLIELFRTLYRRTKIDRLASSFHRRAKPDGEFHVTCESIATLSACVCRKNQNQDACL